MARLGFNETGSYTDECRSFISSHGVGGMTLSMSFFLLKVSTE